MRQSNASRFLMTFLFTAMAAGTAAGQGDPFGSGSDSDPFGTKERKVLEKMEEVEAQAKDNAKLRAHLNEVHNKLLQMREQIRSRDNALSESRQQLNALKGQIDRLYEARDTLGSVHNEFISAMINSKANQGAALNYLVDLADAINGKRAHPAARVRRLSDTHIKLDSSAIERLMEISDSDDASARKLASKVLIEFAPDSEMLGYQQGAMWLPVSDSLEDKLRRRLMARQSFHYDETPLREILERLGKACEAEIKWPESLDLDQPITYRSETGNTMTFLDNVLDKFDMNYTIQSGDILIFKKSDPDVDKTRSYHVRGLLTPTLTIDSLIKLAKDKLKSDSDLWTIDKLDDHRFVFSGSEKANQRLGVFLAGLNPVAER